MKEIKEKAPLSGGSQTIEANQELKTSILLYNNEDETSNAVSAETANDIDEECEDQQIGIHSLTDDLKNQINAAQTEDEVALYCIEHIVEMHNRSHSSDTAASYEELLSYESTVLELYRNAVVYHNSIPNSKYWKVPEKLTKAQTEALFDEIPVESNHNYSEVLEEVTSERISEYLKNHPDITPLVSTNHYINDRNDRHIKVLVDDIIRAVNERIKNHNRYDKSCRWPVLRELNNAQIVDIIAAIYPVVSVNMCNTYNATDEVLLLCVYINDPNDKLYGIYCGDAGVFQTIIRKFRYGIKKSDIEEITYQLKSQLPRRKCEDDKDLIAVGNGIFDFRTKVLESFSPERVFLSKSPVDYVENPENPVLRYLSDGTDTGEDWDVESWMKTLSDDPEIVDLLWKICGAIIRPNNRWNTSAWLYSESGNSGKGTLCELMRQLCGENGHTSIPLADFSKDFLLEPLIHVSAIIVDENDVGEFNEKGANFKAVVTNDVININRKYKQPLTYQFRGFMVQCINDFPRFKDKSESFYRRQRFIPMTKCFTGHEKKYIKEDYLHNPEVLEYVLHKVLNMNYYTLEEPTACRELKNEYKLFNDPIRLFFDEIRTQFKWDRYPIELLFALYVGWMEKCNPSGQKFGIELFKREMRVIVDNDPVWEFPKDNFRHTDNMLTRPEPLLAKYNARDWIDTSSNDKDALYRRGLPIAKFTKSHYHGIKMRGIIDTDASD